MTAVPLTKETVDSITIFTEPVLKTFFECDVV